MPETNFTYESNWNLTYRLFLSDEISPMGTSIKINCAEHTSFVEEITSFEATCMNDGWNVSHQIGCMTRQSILDGDSEVYKCDNLTLSENRCLYPLCSDINGTESTLSISDETHSLALYEDVLLIRNEAGMNVSIECKEEGKLTSLNQSNMHLLFHEEIKLMWELL